MGEFQMSEWTQTRAPTHPGAILREDVLPALGMTVTGLAEAIGVSRQQVHRIMAETAPVTPEMALRLGKFCGNGPDLWLRMQTSYDLWNASRKLAWEIDHISPGHRPSHGKHEWEVDHISPRISQDGTMMKKAAASLGGGGRRVVYRDQKIGGLRVAARTTGKRRG
jgi:antitoxin HigA-1